MAITPLQCAIQHYAWGSHDSIPRLLNLTSPKELPWAEMWMGTHPKGPSKLPDGTSLARWIENNSDITLGYSRSLDSPASLPFLFKILAAQRPLSLQCHPNKAQARSGYAAEQEAGIPVDAPERNYRDANHKPELIVALEEFWALKGFRAPSQIAALFRMAQIRIVEPLLKTLSGPDGLKLFYSSLLSLTKDEIATMLEQLAQGLAQLPADEARWSRELLARYPSDQGATAALILNLVRLSPGQGIFLEAGELHAYLLGTGLELMASSDNVLRAGLTPKHVDRKELLRVLRFEHQDVRILEPSDEASQFTYPTPCSDFALTHLTLQPGAQQLRQVSGGEIWLSLGDALTLQNDEGCHSLTTGQVVFVSADTSAVTISGGGSDPSHLWIASTG